MARKDIRSIADLTPDPDNANLHTARGTGMLERSLGDYGAGRSVLADQHGVVIAGNATVEAAAALGLDILPVHTTGNQLVVVVRDDLDLATDPSAKGLALADNRVAEVNLSWDAAAIADRRADGVDVDAFWRADEFDALVEQAARAVVDADDDGTPPDPAEVAVVRSTLAERFLVPPFSVLDARQGYWQDRKRAWMSLGIQSELGRGDSPGGTLARTFGQDLMRGEHVVGAPSRQPQYSHGLTMKADNGNDLAYYYKKQEAERRLGRALTTDEFQRDHYQGPDPYTSGTSIFDPVLTELAYRWFSPPDAAILDPFAGGSVRGIVASVLARRYVGIDLSERQLDANAVQAARICPDAPPVWIGGDARDAPSLVADAGPFDFVFSCPPYADLERYSDDPRDLSTMPYDDFLAAYRDVVAASLSLLRDDRFACFVVGDVRDTRGLYRSFVADTVAAFRDAGAALYNDAVLVTAVGSLSIRVARQFVSGRKLGKTHQNVLVFVKGDPRRATDACGPVEIGDLPEPNDDAPPLDTDPTDGPP